MRDITRKFPSLRTAAGIGVVLCQPGTLQLIRDRALPKGDLFDTAKAAAFLGAKNTAHLLPHCHPVRIDAMNIDYDFLEPENCPEEIDELKGQYGIIIRLEAKAIDRTGIEMEVLTAISIAALSIYDMLKPVDKEIGISSIKLLSKKGGKSDRKKLYEKRSHTAAILVCSDKGAAGERDDKSGKRIKEILSDFNMDIVDFQVVPDEADQIREKVMEWVGRDIHYIFTTGGTGLSPRDVTIEAIEPMLEKNAMGVAEAMRAHGQERTQVAMLSRQVAGSIKQSTVICMPGSTAAIQECLDAIFPAILYTRMVLCQGLDKS